MGTLGCFDPCFLARHTRLLYAEEGAYNIAMPTYSTVREARIFKSGGLYRARATARTKLTHLTVINCKLHGR
jgi:hypothetical protein